MNSFDIENLKKTLNGKYRMRIGMVHLAGKPVISITVVAGLFEHRLTTDEDFDGLYFDDRAYCENGQETLGRRILHGRQFSLNKYMLKQAALGDTRERAKVQAYVARKMAKLAEAE